MRANKKKTILRDEDSEDSTTPDATATAIPYGGPQEVVQEGGIPITKVVDGKITADRDSDSKDNLPIRFCVKRRLEEPSVATSAEIPNSQQAKRMKEITNDTLVRMGLAKADASIPDGSTNPDGTIIPDAFVTPDAANVITVDETFSSPVEPRKKSVDCSREDVQRLDQQLQQDKMSESEKKRKAEEDHSAMKVYKKQKTRRTLSTALDTQEPGTQSVSDIHEVENVQSVAAAQGAIPDNAANPDEDAIPDKAANHDEGANPDKGATPDEEPNPDKVANPDASTAAQVVTQEPLTHSIKEGQATQEPPTQREGESFTEAGSGKFSY